MTNILDDYEEGMWTPPLAPGMELPRYHVLIGHYTKVGRLVHTQVSLAFRPPWYVKLWLWVRGKTR